MLSVILYKAATHFRKATHTTATMSPKLTEWFGSGYDDCINMLALEPEITAFIYLSDGYLMVVEGITILWDLSE